MFKRTSQVKSVETTTLTFSSTLQIGDASHIEAYSKVLADQREGDVFYGNEGSFNYPVFSLQLPTPPITEPINTCFINRSPFIKVGSVKFIGISFSAVAVIGNIRTAKMQTRIKHIRELRTKKKQNNKG